MMTAKTNDILDPEMVSRFDVPVPRYTSYPTAMSFTDDVDTEVITSRMDAEEADGPLSLYFHLPFCRQLCWYCACTKVITKKQARSGGYLDRVLTEVERRLPWMRDREVIQLHLGGGTPTFFEATELEALGRFLRERLSFAEDAELSVEIDPRELDAARLAALRTAGFNRASLGVQDHDVRVQKIINRDQSYELTRDVTHQLRESGMGSVNFDLVYGLPGQTLDSFTRTMEEVISLRPDRLAIYSYAHVPWAAPAQKLLTRVADLPTAAEKIALFVRAVQMLLEAGWTHIGMDHFALPDDELAKALNEGTLRRNFQGYSTMFGTDIHGFGMSAISETSDMYFQNAKDISDWEGALDDGQIPFVRGVVLTAEDRLRRDLIMGVMCSNRVRFDEISSAHGVDVQEEMAAELAQLQQFADEGLIELDADGFGVTPRGRFFVRNIAATFDQYRGGLAGFSRAV